jgi:nitrite reductase (NADH) large subunit
VVVDDRMATSAPGIFAAGDVAEHGGMTLGLWPIAAKQGEVAAVNALGGDATLTAEVPATILKGVGVDLFSIGRSQQQEGDEIVVDEVADPRAPSYRRLLIADGVAVGAIVLGSHPEVVALVTAAVKNRAPVSPAQIAAVRGGDWEALKDSRPVSQLSEA